MKAIVVAGGGGFLGRHLCRHFNASGWRVVSAGRSAAADAHEDHRLELPGPELDALLARTQPALFINCCGRPSVAASMTDPLGDFNASVVVTASILDSLRRTSPQTAFLCMSSAAVYGNPASLPVSESGEISPTSPYGYHKHDEELLCAEYSRLFGMRTAALRVFSAYGEGLHRQVVWDLANKIVSQPEVAIQGTGDESRDFIHGSDVARAADLVAAKGALRGEPYNVACGVETTVRHLVELIASCAGVSPRLKFDGRNPPGYPARWHADISKLASLGFAGAVSLEDGIRGVLAEVRLCAPIT